MKLYVDGEVLHRTALLLEPYAVSDDAVAKDKVGPHDLDAVVVKLDAAGLQAHMHAYWRPGRAHGPGL